MTVDDVQAMVEDYVAAAVRAEQAGFDGVEVHGAHGFLLAQFLDRRNQRPDRQMLTSPVVDFVDMSLRDVYAPIGRLGGAGEIAAAVLWLCIPTASFVISAALPVDGGFVATNHYPTSGTAVQGIPGIDRLALTPRAITHAA